MTEHRTIEKRVRLGGEPAFPCELHPGSAQGAGFGGLTKREYFAAAALNAMVGDYDGGMTTLGQMARDAVTLADLLIARLDGTLND